MSAACALASCPAVGCSPASHTPFVAHANKRRPWGQRCRQQAAAAASRGGGASGSDASGGGSGGDSSGELRRRREVILQSVNWAILGEMAGGDMDGRTVINSILGAYGLPKLRSTPGFRIYDDPEEPFSFQFPTAWVRRKNMLREGLYIADYSTADKLSVEVFPEPDSSTPLAEAAVQKLINPAVEIGGDGRLEMPPASRIRTSVREIDGKAYTYLNFPSETITRSGYQVRRKNMAVAAVRRGNVYVLGCSARSDQFNADKEQTFQTIVDSFRLI